MRPKRGWRARIAIAAAGLLIGCVLPAFAQDLVKIGIVEIRVPQLPEFSLAKSGSAAWLTAESVTPPANRLLATYQPRRAEDIQSTRWLMLQSFRAMERVSMSRGEFESTKAAFRGLANNESMKAVKDQANATDVKGFEKVKVGEIQVIEAYDETDTSISMLMLSTYKVAREGGGSLEVPVVVGYSLVELKGKMAFLYVYSSQDTIESRDWVKSQTRSWLAAARHGNS
jgi:hypothetical protein